MSKHKRWKRKIRRARWRSTKREALAAGLYEPIMNLLVPRTRKIDIYGPQPPREVCRRMGWTPMHVLTIETRR